MALKSPLMPSPSGHGISSAFSPSSESPSSPARFTHHHFSSSSIGLGPSNRSSGPTDSLAPPQSPYPQTIEPSPTDSNGTESTDIDEDAQEDPRPNSSTPTGTAGGDSSGDALEVQSPDIEITSPSSAISEYPPKLDTKLPAEHRFTNDGPQSVIHVPSGFKNFDDLSSYQNSPSQPSDTVIASPSTPEASVLRPYDMKRSSNSSVSPVNTNIPVVTERSTPRAQTRQELDEEHHRKRGRTPSLEGIPEAQDKDGDEANENKSAPSTAGLVGEGSMVQVVETLHQAEHELTALHTALSECWTLCNTLAGLSSTHRHRTFKFTGRTEVQEHAWRSCWRLCQQLYDHRDEDHTSQVTPTMELCRDFCQALFDARQKGDEASDSVLRVSFELNNHLYNTHDRSLPDAFNERTLDFYVTLCHRLMKSRTSLPQETDALLRACWSLAEMLFNLRQASRDGRQPDEELLGSAVQACWELCDLFREGWTQIRPERGTPRPSQQTFGSQASLKSGQSNRSEGRSTSSTRSGRKYHEAPTFPPETPITIFDDASTAASSPDLSNAPNILVLGPASTGSSSVRLGSTPHHDRWTSSASVLSDYSDSGVSSSSQRSSSTATAGGENSHLTRIRYLLVKAGMNTGYVRTSSQTLPLYVKELPENAFGTLPWQLKVLSYYRKLVVHDKSMLTAHSLPTRRLGAAEVAKSVRWLGSSEQWAWMRDLFRIVFGFGVDEAVRRGGSFSI